MIGRPARVLSGPDHYAYVTVTGEGALATLVAAIGVPPDEGWDRDAKPSRGNRERYGFSRWSLFSGLPRGAPVDAHLTAVLDRLEPFADGFCSLGPEWRRHVSVTGFFEDPSELIAISVLNHGRAATLGLGYDFDFYFEGG